MRTILLCAAALLIVGAGGLSARPPMNQTPRGAARLDTDVSLHPQFSTAASDTFVLGDWTFDDGGGGGDAQGWSGVDVHAQDVYFHVDDFAGMGPPYAPLEGGQSMWCGLRSAGCGYATLPGYGHSWRQRFETTAGFAATGDVTVSYLIRYDSEPGYDFTHVEYLSATGTWRELTKYDGSGSAFASLTVPADSLAGTVSLRFRFESDGAWDDADGLVDTHGAVVIDSLTVSDAVGELDYQDFESESVGALATSDGDWQCVAGSTPGNFTGLFDGSTVLQEDTVTTNTTHLWGFFNGSTDDYSCGGHPEQAVVPLTTHPGSDKPTDFVWNETRSPIVPFDEDINGQPVPWASQTLLVAFDVYTDLPYINSVYYNCRVRFWVDGCPGGWQRLDPVGYYNPSKSWHHQVFDFSERVPEGATHVQVGLGAFDWCFAYGGGNCPCHSQGPLFDNVTLYRVLDPATGAGDTPAAASRLDQNYPNPFNPTTTVHYTLARPGVVTLRVYDVAGRLVRTLVDARQSPRADGYSVRWDGRDDAGRVAPTGIYLYRLQTPDLVQTRKMVLLK